MRDRVRFTDVRRASEMFSAPGSNSLRSSAVLTRSAAAAVVLLALSAACATEPVPVPDAARLGQWIWTRADVARFAESDGALPGLDAGVFIGAVHCDGATGQLVTRAGLSPGITGAAGVTAVIRFEDGLDRCRTANDAAERFNQALDSAVMVLRTRGGETPVQAVQLDYDAPQRALAAWATSVRYLRTKSLVSDSVWVTSLIAHVREPAYGDLFRGVVQGHVLQVFDTGEPATERQVDEALRLVARARLPFRLGLGAFERRTAVGVTDHRAWFGTVPSFKRVRGYRGLWIFPAGFRWTSLLQERA
jgi:hypothetical protein